jgi:hypothetical protein
MRTAPRPVQHEPRVLPVGTLPPPAQQVVELLSFALRPTGLSKRRMEAAYVQPGGVSVVRPGAQFGDAEELP